MKALRSVGVLVALALLLAACKAPGPEGAVKLPKGRGEAPMLAAAVAKGELPPVKERLPENPKVVKPVKETGQYGGTLRFGFVGRDIAWGGAYYIDGWEHLVTWNTEFSDIEPNIAESWEVNENLSEYTFHLRKGIKWSDGHPYTADDILFYINDYLYNKELRASGPINAWLPRTERETFKIEKIDDYTVKFIFAKPYGLFLYKLALFAGRKFGFYPKHWLKQFHKDYNPEVDKLVAQEEGVEDWVKLFKKKTGDSGKHFNEVDRPVLYPFVVKEGFGTGTQALLERNPYYWKVDSQGNQLPYLDKVLVISYHDGESRTFAMMNGDLDVIKDPGVENRVVYYEALEAGKPIWINTSYSDDGNVNSIHFNRTLADPFKAKIFASKDFRIGMSHAINRAEIIEIIHSGQGEPAQVAPLEGSVLYNEQLATQYLEYDLELAGQYLDKVLPNKDGEGFRLGENGRRFSIVLAVANDLSWATHWVPTAELLIQHWAAVGVDVMLNAMPESQFDERWKDNTLEATLFTGEGGAGLTGLLDPRYYVPGSNTYSLYTNGWNNWWGNRQNMTRVEPPQWAKDFRQAFYGDVLQAPTKEEQIKEMKRVLQMAADEFWVIGIARSGSSYQPWSTGMGNIPDEWTQGFMTGVFKHIRPEQWYLKQ